MSNYDYMLNPEQDRCWVIIGETMRASGPWLKSSGSVVVVPAAEVERLREELGRAVETRENANRVSARDRAENIDGEYPGTARLLRDLASAIDQLAGGEMVRLVHPNGGRVLVELPMDVGVFGQMCGRLAELGFHFARDQEGGRTYERTFGLAFRCEGEEARDAG